MFTKAIIKKPCPSLIDGITSANLGIPIYEKAVAQHAQYARILEDLGLSVTKQEGNNHFPDAVFVEDVALCMDTFAVITKPGAVSRREETLEMEPTIRHFFKNIERIISPGTLEGGDVMQVDKHFYIGISGRTNEEGARQLLGILKKYGCPGTTVPLKETLHLKSGVNYLDNNNLLICGEFVNNSIFAKFHRMIVDPEEAYAANSLWINGTVIVPKGFPKTLRQIQQAGYPTIEIDMSEFQKVDGGLSCLSLRF
jgi:dimethylargininase